MIRKKTLFILCSAAVMLFCILLPDGLIAVKASAEEVREELLLAEETEPSDETSIAAAVNGAAGLSISVFRDGISSIRIEWSETADAEYYELYRKIDDGVWKKVKNVTGTYTSNLDLEAGHYYSYRLRAKFADNTYSEYSEEEGCYFVNSLNAPQNISVRLQGAASAVLSWDAVDGAEEYVIYRSVNNGSWQKLKSEAVCSAANYGLNESVSYSYKIYARCGDSYSSFSEAVSFKLPNKPAPPVISVSQYGMNTALIKWDNPDGAAKYNIYRSDNGGSWKFIKSTADTLAYNYALKEGVSYTYKVNAVYEADGACFTSDYSDEISFQLGSGIGTPGVVSVKRLSNTCAELSWDAVDGAAGYSLYRFDDEAGWKKVKDINEELTRNYSLSLGAVYGYCIRAYKAEETVKSYGLASEAVYYWNSGCVTIRLNSSGGENIVSWNKMPGADSYKVYLNGELYESTSEEEICFPNDTAGEVFVTACKLYNDKELQSPKSNTVLTEAAAEINYRALLIGETSYAQKLNGPENDVEAMRNIIAGLHMGYDIYSQLDATKDEIIALIDIAFADAGENDISLFYYSGHGVTGSGTYYSGAIQTVDYQYITTQDLAELLSYVRGKVIVIMDSCGSGAMISDGASTESLNDTVSVFSVEDDSAQNDSSIDEVFDAERFSQGLIEAFQVYNSYMTDSAAAYGAINSNELSEGKFYVLTSSGYEEASLTTNSGGYWGGLLTKGLASCTGFTYPSGAFSGAFMGDANGDGKISLCECASYCSAYVEQRQNVLSYPGGSNFILFFIGQ